MKKRFRKRKAQTRSESSLKSPIRRRIRNSIQRRDFPAALQEIDSELTNESNPLNKARLVALAGRVDFKRGRFDKADEAFKKAGELSKEHSRDWFSPRLGSVQSLLKAVRVEEAVSEARGCLTDAESRADQFASLGQDVDRQLATKGVARIPIKPHRVSVIASRLGTAFLEEGELEVAREFFEKALVGNPKGGCRARQGLAAIALRSDEPEKAMQRAVEAITLGKYQAKTISAWPLLIAAIADLGRRELGAELLAAVQSAKPSVRARTLLVIVSELRRRGMEQWRTIAEKWLKKDSGVFVSVDAEFNKLLMTEEKRKSTNPKEQIRMARVLLATPNLSPSEWLSAAKELVRARLFDDKNPQTDELLAEASRLFGETFRLQAMHSLALSCMMAKRHDLARPLLRRVMAQAPQDQPVFGKAIWALARMEKFLGNHAVAVSLYRMIADSASVPQRFRLQAQILWLEALAASGDTHKMIAASREIHAATLTIEDPDILMNFARQLIFAPGEASSIAKGLFERGEQLALAAFQKTEDPSEAITLLFKLARRQVLDFYRHAEAVSVWESLTLQKRDWLWSNNNHFWEYLGLIFQAYIGLKKTTEAESLAAKYLNDPATPSTGLVLLGIPYALWLIRSERYVEALEQFEWMVSASPAHPLCAHAYYWLALRASKLGDAPLTKEYARLMQSAIGPKPSMLSQSQLEAQALLLQVDLRMELVSKQAVNHSPQALESHLSQIKADLASLKL